jgi:hypothetical protein
MGGNHQGAKRISSAATGTHQSPRWHRTVLWAAKTEKSRHLFNYKAMKAVTGKQMKTVWKMPAPGKAEKQFGKHPTQKPVALVERCLPASMNEGDLVLDPFWAAAPPPSPAPRLTGISSALSWISRISSSPPSEPTGK